MKVRDMLVKTSNPKALDKIVQTFAAAVCGGEFPTTIDGACVVRCFGDADFVKFAIEHQGYGEVVKVFEGSYQEGEI